MKLKFRPRNHTEGIITVETAICSAALILLFALFFTITGYCRGYLSVKEYLNEKAQDTAILGYSLDINVPGIIPAHDFKGVKNGSIKNLFIYCENWGEEVRLNASYTYESLLGGFRVKMILSFTKWTGDAPLEDKSVWELLPIERGREIEKIFGGGLPEFFPVLDAFDPISGHAAVIVSIDTSLSRYENGSYLKKIVNEKCSDLIEFTYGKYEETVITGMDIDSRELIVVIPENQLNEMQETAMGECMDYIADKAILLTIKRYQYACNTLSEER